MISVLVAHSYFLKFDRKQLQRAKPYPPLATLQVAAELRAQGHQVSFFDAMLAQSVAEYELKFKETQPALALFYEDNYNYLSKMCLGRMRLATFEMITVARQGGARVIVAGSDASDAPQEYLSAGADLVLIGEGRATLRRLLQRLDVDVRIGNLAWSDGLNGICTLIEGDTHRGRGAARAPDREHPAPPAWDLVDVHHYRSVWQRAHGYFSLNMAASRGCSFRCNWCAKPIWGNSYLQRAAHDVAAEMAFLKQEFRPDHIWFADDIFGFRVDWVKQFAIEVDRLCGSLPFTIQTRADLVSDEMAEALRDARCQEVWIGAESGSQRILDRMNKGTSVQEIYLARTRLRQVGIRVGFFIQLGYLGEELEDILSTRELVERARPDDVGVSVSYPLPGTKFYEAVKEQLRAQKHWQESSDLAMMFEGTYSSAFYRAVRDLLHEEVSPRSLSGGAYGHSQESLAQRWDLLISQEQRHRAAASLASDATASAFSR
jgi:anaerobic magnesium-protoporphyrin IX monomethyl ester cyclase